MVTIRIWNQKHLINEDNLNLVNENSRQFGKCVYWKVFFQSIFSHNFKAYIGMHSTTTDLKSITMSMNAMFEIEMGKVLKDWKSFYFWMTKMDDGCFEMCAIIILERNYRKSHSKLVHLRSKLRLNPKCFGNTCDQD